jgi:hypothetical protein
MSYNITVEAATKWVAGKWLEFDEPNITPKKKATLLPSLQYNALVYAFNASTILLTAAVAIAFFATLSAAVSIAGVALFVRWCTEKELDKATVPASPSGGMLDAVYNYISNQVTLEVKKGALFGKLGIAQPAEWHMNVLTVFDHVLWKSAVPIPKA